MSYDVLTPSAARLWQYAPDWSRGFDVKRSFLTDITGPSRDGTEQRRSIRDAPRLSASYRTIVSGADRRAADLFLRAGQNLPSVVPDFARWARLTGSSAAASTTITVSPMPVWAAAGQPFVLCQAGIQEEVLAIGVTGSVITLDDPLVNNWAIGDVLRPSFFGLLNGNISSTRPNGGTASIDVSIDCYPGGEPPRDAGTAWASLNSIEIFTQVPDYAGAPQIGHVWPVDQIDYNIGRTAQFRPVTFMSRTLQGQFTGLPVNLATAFEQFFDRMKGRRTAFYLPTFEDDFVLAASAGSGANTFTASGPDLASNFSGTDYSAVNEGVAVYLTDGSVIYRRITSITASGGNSVVHVNAAWGTALSTANVARISRMPLTRFASDDMTMNWKTPLKASTQLTFQQVNA